MSGQNWLAAVRDANKRCYLINGNKRVHYKFLDGKEMVEEYSLRTGMVVKRAVLINSNIIGPPRWEIEIGEPDSLFEGDPERMAIVESSTNPILTARITKVSLEWRIRNLPYPLDMYDVVADPDRYCVIVKTRNKKYYKVIKVGDLERIGVKPEQNSIGYKHQYNTLIITYDKPAELVLTERLVFEEINRCELDGDDSHCTQS